MTPKRTTVSCRPSRMAPQIGVRAAAWASESGGGLSPAGRSRSAVGASTSTRRPRLTMRVTTARLAPDRSASWAAVSGSVAAAKTFACEGVSRGVGWSLEGGGGSRCGCWRLPADSRTPAGRTASRTSPWRHIQRSLIQAVSSSIVGESSGRSSSTLSTSFSPEPGISLLATATQ